MLKAIIFDWGNTLMKDFPEKLGPMAFWDKVELMPYAKDALEYLEKKGYMLVVATNAGISDTTLMKMALNRGGIDKHFSHFFSSKDLGVSKPDPRFFLSICMEINLLPDECLMIGNDYNKDILGAKTAGLKTLWLKESEEVVDIAISATPFIKSLKELINHEIIN